MTESESEGDEAPDKSTKVGKHKPIYFVTLNHAGHTHIYLP